MIVSLEKEKAETQLDLLKQQLNPHFFFNTLNNLYALSLERSEETPEVILQLSDLMRYVIYKAKEPYVSMEDEVKYLKDYLQLQSIRLHDKLELHFRENIVVSEFKIAPLLLIVLVENAVKHGVESSENAAVIEIGIRVTKDKFYFFCKNSFEPKPGNSMGIGLANLKKRLELLYPQKHRLTITEEKTIFRVELELDAYALPDR